MQSSTPPPDEEPTDDGPDSVTDALATSPEAPTGDAPSVDAGPEATPPERYYLAYSATTNVGKIRKNNQDSGYASPGLLVIADGMGGAAAGDLASAVAIDVISRMGREATGRAMLAEFDQAVRTANDRLADIVADDPAKEGMGTTVSGALFDGHQLGLAHIGDSRGYLLRDGEFEQLTHDHSWVQSLIDDGKITEEEAEFHPHRSLLLRVLNGQPNNEPDLAMLNVKVGDRLLFCSDGLCGFVPDPVLADLLAEPDRDEALQLLMNEALDAGGLDNITIIVGDVVETPPADPPQPIMLGAATEVEIPDPDQPSRTIDLGDSEPPDPNAKPAAPPPVGVDDEDRYAPVPPPRRHWPKRLAIVLVALFVVAAGAVAAVGWGRTQFFVGAAGGQIAIYQGIPDIVPGVHTSRVYELHPTKIADLPTYYRDQVVGTIRAASLESARQTVAELETIAQRCIRIRDQQPPSATPTPSASDQPGGLSPGPDASPTPGASATPSGSTEPSGSTGPSGSSSPSLPESPAPSTSTGPGTTGSCE